jgi:hypothetical protein
MFSTTDATSLVGARDRGCYMLTKIDATSLAAVPGTEVDGH